MRNGVSVLPYRVVIIDDEKEISNGFARFFPWKDLGFTVTRQFAGAKSALQFIMNNQVDLVVSDVIMPGMTGIDLARELGATKFDPQPLIILFSAHDEFEYARDAIRYRCADYVLKSTEYEELIRIFRGFKERLDRERGIKEEREEDKIIVSIKDYVKQNPVEANLDAAAASVFLSPAYVSRYFRQKTSINFSKYLLKVKMEQAAVLLSDLKYKIYDISDRLGYTNPENFARSFRKFYHMSPKEYRYEKLGRNHPEDNL
jgi:YesN/AraC family two-component response regulator